MNVLTTHHFLERIRLTAVRTNLSHPLPPTQTEQPRACRCFYCSPQLYAHDHPQPIVRPSRSWNREARFVLQPNSHEPLALASLAINWFQPVDYSYARDQRAAIAKWYALQTAHIVNFSPPDNLAAQLTLLRRAYKIFNTIFFCRKLPSVYIDWSNPRSATHPPPWVARTVISTNTLKRTRITFHVGYVSERRVQPNLVVQLQTLYWLLSGRTRSTDFEARLRAHVMSETLC
jgi:hypothetical protein